MAGGPDRLYVDRGDRELYDQDEVSAEIWEGRTRKEQFLLAMAVGFKSEVRRALETRENFFLAKDMHRRDEALLDAVAIYETGSADVLADREAVYRIAEEYAHAGVRLLCDRVASGQPGSFYKKLEVELVELSEGVSPE